MRVFILSCLVAIVVARPDIGLTLQQQQSQHVLPLNAHSAQPHVYQQLPQEHSFAGFAGQQQQLNQYPPSMLYGAPAQPQQQQQVDAPLPLAPEEPTPSPVNYAEDTYQMALRHSAMPHASGYQSGPQETKVHKHIYVHVPPKDFEEEDAVQPRVHHQQAPKQKHYKIVFIKAPSAPAARAPIVAPPPQNEEKTLIYVLHKKPEMDQDIVIPTAPPTKPSKPEVYFIKYKTKKEEHPVYGPPPQQQQGELMDMEPRNQGEQTQVDFGAMNVADLLPPTTMQAMLNEQQQPQLLSAADQQQPQSLYSAPTVSAYTGEEVPPTTLAAPSQQYLPAAQEAPQAPIIVEEQQQQREEPQPQQPATSYIPPPAGNRYFLKRRK